MVFPSFSPYAHVRDTPEMAGVVTFVNADIGGAITSLSVVGSLIAAVGDGARAGGRVVDLRGDRLLPGLINAHDHLHLNTVPPLEPTGHWRHVREWVAEVNLRRRTDSAFESRLAVALNERLLIGGVKNLLSGVTTVAHHDPLYPFLVNGGFPVGVLTHFGWSHSLYIDGDERVRQAHLRTPRQWPWIIHLAEGVDAEAAAELERLDTLGCLQANTLVVHGIALDRSQRTRLVSAGAGLIWCPSSNMRLFGRTAQVSELISCGRVALGTDSRFSGSRDLLCELRTAREAASLEAGTLESLVTRDAATLLRLTDRGVLSAAARADLVVLPAGMALSEASRADIRLVMLGGLPLYADADYAGALAPSNHWACVHVDGKPKKLGSRLAAALCTATVSEPGLQISDLTWRAA
jgi:cytosine/adenosine deaminase-related metal-dependent hydrolase